MRPSSLFGLAALLELAAATPLLARDGTSGGNETSTCTSLNQRKAWHTLTDEEKSAYLSAVQCLMNTPAKTGTIPNAKTIWDELQYAHLVQSNFIHGVGAFLPWHRLIVRAHEQLLQTVCGYTGAQPYWHAQRDFALSPYVADASVFGSDAALSFGTNGVNTTAGTNCVTDGAFANTTLNFDIWLGNVTNDSYCLSRSFNDSSWALANQTYVDVCRAYDTYEGANMCFVDSPHTCGHLGTGGTMADNDASPGDPLFFLHHANLDRLWWQWQKDNLTQRLTEMEGSNIPPTTVATANGWLYPSEAFLRYDGDPAPGLNTTLNHVLWTHDVVQNYTIADVMDLTGEVICAEYVEADDYTA